jgi:hypothetical protein
MITTKGATALAGLGLALPLALAGCSSSDPVDTSAAWCQGAASVAQELDELATLVENGSSTDLVKTQLNAVEAAIEANSVPLTQLPDDAQAEVAAAYDAFGAAVAAIPEDAAPAEASAQYREAITALDADIEAVESEVCA